VPIKISFMKGGNSILFRLVSEGLPSEGVSCSVRSLTILLTEVKEYGFLTCSKQLVLSIPFMLNLKLINKNVKFLEQDKNRTQSWNS